MYWMHPALLTCQHHQTLQRSYKLVPSQAAETMFPSALLVAPNSCTRLGVSQDPVPYPVPSTGSLITTRPQFTSSRSGSTQEDLICNMDLVASG